MNAKEILQLAGWPTKYIVLDFETYFDDEYSLTNMSSWEYITDEQYETIGVGVQSNLFFPGSPRIYADGRDVHKLFVRLQALAGYNFEDAVLIVQNAQFDPLILKVQYRINPKYIIDVKHLAAHFDSRMSHKLKDLAKRFGLQAKGDTMNFKGLHFADMTDEQRQDMKGYCLNDVDLEAKLFEILLPRLSNPAFELEVAQHTTQMYLTPRLSFDFDLAADLESKMQGFLDEACAKVGMTKDEVSGDLSFTKVLIEALPQGESVPVKAHKRPGKKMTALLGRPGVGPALAKTDEECQLLEVHPDPRVRALMEVRKAVGSWPIHLKRIGKLRALATACNGRLPVPLNYYGAHTGRWSGGGGINLQNMGGKGRTGSGNHPLLRKMREMLKVNDSSLIIVDSAQIEARVLAWLAGQDDLIQGFADGRDVYSEFATKLFRAMVRKPRETDPPPIKKILSLRRGFGKDTILGCGYGMGANKFFIRCNENPDLRPSFESGQYDRMFVDNLIKAYRITYDQIPKFWRTLEKMFRVVAQFPHEKYQYNTPGALVSAALLTLWNDRGTVNVQLPSGRVLYYPHAAISRSSNRLKYHHGELWGGTLTENVVQAIARDLLAWWILEVEKAGLPVVLHVHDEIIAVSSDPHAEDNLATMMRIVQSGPSWAAGIPLAAEGCISKTYKK